MLLRNGNGGDVVAEPIKNRNIVHKKNRILTVTVIFRDIIMDNS